MIQITRYHDISMGHRVYGHESKCANLHGHNYRFHFTVRPKEGLDDIGRVVDFSRVKEVFCEWLEKNWDHKFMLWKEDPLLNVFDNIVGYGNVDIDGVVPFPFNPTAENIAHYFLTYIAPSLTVNEKWFLYSLTIDETTKCSASATLNEQEIMSIGVFKQLVKMPNEFYYCSRQCGEQRDCMCEGKTDEEKTQCRYCCTDLPF